MAERLTEQKDRIAKRMGRDIFNKVEKILLMHKNADSDSEAIYESLKPIMGKNRELKELCFSLEMIIFKELD